MERPESVLDAIYEDGDGFGGDETLADDDDVEMLDAEAEVAAGSPAAGGGGEAAEGRSLGGAEQRRAGKKKKKKNKRRRKSGSAPNIFDINRFVIDTCRTLKEKKSYLVWNAVGCLGVSAFRDLVKEVNVIQDCGGQRTIDGKRMRTGGGILWNILKTREPKAYKEIMAKGREFEKQLMQPKKRQKTDGKAAEVSMNRCAPDEAAEEVLNSSEGLPELQGESEPPDSSKGRISVKDRIRVPVSYDDLFEEGEIHE